MVLPMEEKLLKNPLTVRGDSLYCPLSLSLDSYGNCLTDCWHSYLRNLNHIWGTDLKPAGKEKMQQIPGLSVNILRNRSGSGIAAYVFLYDGEFVDNPLLLQFRITFKTLISLKKPMTIFFVYDKGCPQDAPFNTSLAAKVLAGSIRSFNSQIPKKSHKGKNHL